MAEQNYCDKCGYVVEQCECEKPQTNADRIRAMSDEELAEFLSHYMSCGYCDARNKEQGCKDCKAELLQWLKSEAKE